jgi:hypothetical protein
MTAPILFIAGAGRCGTTMVMTMLDKGGFPVAGARPDYEMDQMSAGRVDHAWVRAQAGRAVKWIAPDLSPIRPADLQGVPAVTLMLHRDVREQAASVLKMGGMTDGRQARRAAVASLKRSEPVIRSIVYALGPVYHLDFESILLDPLRAAGRLEELIIDHFDRGFAIDKAAIVPIARSPKCAPDLSFELGLAGGAV